MTQEGQGPRPDDTLTPPTTTRWSDESAGATEDGLVPPFLPGRPPRAGAPETATVSETTVEPEPADEAEDAFPFDMPWADEPAQGADEEVELAEAPLPDDEFPLEAFDIESGDEPELPGYEPVRTPADRSAAEEVAERLERLASRLRSEGADGVERELASSDRLTSLLAALLAGHLASR